MVWFARKRIRHGAIKESPPSLIDVLMYTILIIVVCTWHMQVSTLLVYLYTFTFTIIQIYLEKQLGATGLVLAVYNPVDWILFCNNFILAVGMLWAFLTHRASLTESIQYTITFIWRALWRIGLITAALFCVLTLCLCGYYAYQFLQLSTVQGPQGPFVLRPIKYVLKLFGNYEYAKELWANIFRLPKAERLFAQMNEWSLVIWYAVHVGAIASTLWAVAMVKRLLVGIDKK